MRSRRGHVSTIREVGSALAVLAVWLLVLLAPLHQTSSLMRDLAARGDGPAAVWSRRNPTASGTSDQDQATVLCPLQGIGKAGLLPGSAETAKAELLPAAHLVWDQIRARPPNARPPYALAQPRAPPAFS